MCKDCSIRIQEVRSVRSFAEIFCAVGLLGMCGVLEIRKRRDGRVGVRPYIRRGDIKIRNPKLEVRKAGGLQAQRRRDGLAFLSVGFAGSVGDARGAAGYGLAMPIRVGMTTANSQYMQKPRHRIAPIILPGVIFFLGVGFSSGMVTSL